MPVVSAHGWVLAGLIGLVAAQASTGSKGTGGSNGGGGGGKKAPAMTPGQKAAEAAAESLNRKYATDILIILAAMVVAFGFYRLVISSVRYIRTLTCINNSTQRYFKLPPPTFAIIKKHVLYAPLFRSRRNREFQLFSMNFGVLPTRLQAILMASILAMNAAYCFHEIEWQGPRMTMLEHLRNRTGVLAVVNIVPLVLISGRNNPLIVALNLSFDNFNRFHRFFGRIVAAEAVMHAVVQVTRMVESSKFDVNSIKILLLIDGSGMGGGTQINSGSSIDNDWLHCEWKEATFLSGY